jgi:hypothetical protein
MRLCATILLLPALAFSLNAEPGQHPQKPSPDEPPPVCPASFNDSLATNGIATKDDPGVLPATPVFTPAVKFSGQARKAPEKQHRKYFFADGEIGLVVDAAGNTTDLCLLEPAGYASMLKL